MHVTREGLRRSRRPRPRLLHLLTGLGLIAAAGLGAATSAAAATADYGKTPGTYTNYAFSGTTELTDVEFGIKVTDDPGTSAKVFWSNQFNFTNNNGAYTGMQATGVGNQRLFLFSVWDATEAKVGSAGSWCQDFGGEGVGKSCRINVDWLQGHEYRFAVAHEGDRWFGVTVTDKTAGTSFKIGSIRAGADRISTGGMVNWAEYFEWNSPLATCYDQPYSRAEFLLPRGNTGGVTATVSGTSVSDACASMSQVSSGGLGTVHRNAIGNSRRGPVVGLNGVVLDGGSATDGGLVTIRPNAATTTKNQNWVLAADGTLRLGETTGKCLDIKDGSTADGASIITWSCTAGTNQKWERFNGGLRNPASGKCLDIPNSTTTSGTAVKLWTCNGGQNQKWTVG